MKEIVSCILKILPLVFKKLQCYRLFLGITVFNRLIQSQQHQLQSTQKKLEHFRFVISQCQVNLDYYSIWKISVTLDVTLLAVFISSNLSFALSSLMRKIRIKLIKLWGMLSFPTLNGLFIGNWDMRAHLQSAFSIRNSIITCSQESLIFTFR